MNRLADVRQRLREALDPVLPGRVHPYPLPADSRVAAPGMWIGQPTVLRTTIGQRSTGVVASFPITLAYDGADRAAVAGLDELVAQAWDALEATPGLDPSDARPDQLRYADTAVRAVVVTVDVTILARTLCLPAPGQAVIPPALIEEAAHG